ncbi:MAG: ATP-grasp domain-containing protein, partial [Planctomycetota bacterium]
HWKSIFGSEGVPRWESFDSADREKSYLTIFPHEKISASQQAVNPEVNYFLHSKEVIEKIACPQAAVLPRVSYPCVAKLTHGYAALGNFFLRNSEDEREMRNRLADQWPDAKLVVNSMIENIVDDFGVQFYIQKNGGVIWLGLTEQQFDDSFRWCGGVYSHDQQTNLFESLRPFVAATGDYLARRGYFGVAGIDVVQNSSGDMFLVDVNPRLTGVSPFLIASRIFAKKEGWKEGAYHASLKFQGTMDELISKVESVSKARAMVLSAVERTKQGFTICHFSVNSDSQERNLKVVLEIFG